MFKMPEKIEYALPEQIGNPNLFVGRRKEFNFFLGDWYQMLEGNFAQNQAIVSRRKKGKTALLQRLFNILWNSGRDKTTNKVIPFYFSIKDSVTPLNIFSKQFFSTFVNQYISYKESRSDLIVNPIPFEEIGHEIQDETILKWYSSMLYNDKNNGWEEMWRIAAEMPAVIGRVTGNKIVQIIDEFQNINGFIYNQRDRLIDNMSGTYMQVGEMREAPLIVSGSEVHWLLKIVRSLTGRFQIYQLSNLPKEESEEAFNVYAEFTKTRINSRTKEQLWHLTDGDPLYIKALFLSFFNKEKDYTNEENIVTVYEKEICEGEIYATWMEYMLNTFNTVNKKNSKRIMLYLFKQGKERTRAEIVKDLKLPYDDFEAEEKLNALIAGDLISQGKTAYDYTITRDKTYELVFRRVYQKEIEHFVPDIKNEIRKAMGYENYLKGKFAEFMIREKFKKQFDLKSICDTETDSVIIPKMIKERELITIGMNKYEVDLIVIADSNIKPDGLKGQEIEIWIDVKQTQKRYGKNEMRRWLQIADEIKKDKNNILFMVYSENGYTKGTKEQLEENNIFIINPVKINSSQKF